MAGRRVVITGQGWITPLGHDVPGVWSRLLKGESGVSPVGLFDASTWSTNFAAQVQGFELGRWVKDAGRHADASRSTHFLLAAAMQAWRQAGLDRAMSYAPRRVGMYMASGEGPADWLPFSSAVVASYRPESRTINGPAWAERALATLRPVQELQQEPNLALSHLAMELPCRGPASNCMTACAASTQAIGEAFETIRYGDADAMLAGGAHSMIHPLGMTGFIRLTAMSSRRGEPTRAARPFDQTRDGFVMGEGAAVVVLESLEHALARGATPLAEIGGYGSTADAFRITDIAPEHRGAQAAVRHALAQAGLDPTAAGTDGRPLVHWFCAHGTGTKENDKLETAGVKAVFGGLARAVPISSIKSMLGHLIQAAGAAGTIACVEAIRTGMIPPTANYQNPDPECDLDVVPNVARDLKAAGVEACLNNSAGFGGQNDVLLVRRYRA